MSHPKKILAVKFRSMGDTVLMTAPLIQLKRAYPESELHVAVTAEWAPLLRNHPAVDRIWPCERHKEKTSRARAVARLVLQLRKERFDLAVNFHASPSSAGLAFATGAKTRSIHYHGHQARNRFSTVEIPGKGQIKPIIERDMDTIRALGLSVAEGQMPRLYCSALEKDAARGQLKALGLDRQLLVIGPGASRPTKSWPIENFAEVAKLWCQKTGGSVLVLLGEDESRLATALERALGPSQTYPKILIKRGLPIREVMALISQASVFLGNDSGPKHIAVASQVPTVTLFGPEHPFEWHPYPASSHPYFFSEGLSCRKDGDPGMPAWCGLNECIAEKHRCMREIEIGPVFEMTVAKAKACEKYQPL